MSNNTDTPTLTPYQLFQLERYGDILPPQGSYNGYVGSVEQAWYEGQAATREIEEPSTGTHTSVFDAGGGTW